MNLTPSDVGYYESLPGEVTASPVFYENDIMRLTKRELTDKESLIAVLRDGVVLHLAFVDEAGVALFPVNYGFVETDGNVELLFHGATEGRKATFFSQHSHVTFEIDVPEGMITGTYACAYSYAYRSVIGEGDVTLIQDSERKIRCLDLLLDHVTGNEEKREYSTSALERTNVYSLAVSSMTGKRRA